MLLKIRLIIPFLFILFFFSSCSLLKTKDPVIVKKSELFLQADENAPELFRVFLTSDDYLVSQMRDYDLIIKAENQEEDQYTCNQLKQLDKIEIERDGVLKVWLYPDSGQIMKVRMVKPTFLLEIDKIISEDIQRWKFLFPNNIIDPVIFKVRYKIILQKKLSDEEIIKEIQQNLSEEQ